MLVQWRVIQLPVEKNNYTPENERMSPKKGIISIGNTEIHRLQPLIFRGKMLVFRGNSWISKFHTSSTRVRPFRPHGINGRISWDAVS